MIDLLQKITSTISVTGYEYMSHAKIKELLDECFADIFDEVIFDPHGSIELIRRADKSIANPKKIMLDSHLDQIGLMVSEILEDGFVRVKALGGIDIQILIASAFRIYTKDENSFSFDPDRYISAIAVSVPPHLKKDGDTLPKIDDLYLDTGYSEETLKKLLCVGAPVSFEPSFTVLLNGLIAAPGFDDKLCCAALLLAAKKLTVPLKYDLHFTFTAGEEFNSIGAKTSAFRINPDAALVLDVGFSHDPGVDRNESLEMNGGAGLSYSASTSMKLTRAVHAFAKEKKIKVQAIAEPNSTGTNASAVAVTKAGVPCVVISIPLKNMHTNNEICSIADVEMTAQLIAEIINEGGIV